MTNFDYRWVGRAANYMSASRPDIWATQEHAWMQLNEWIRSLDKSVSGGYISTGGFMLTKQVDVAEDENGREFEHVTYELTKHIVDWYDSPEVDEDERTNGFDWINPAWQFDNADTD